MVEQVTKPWESLHSFSPSLVPPGSTLSCSGEQVASTGESEGQQMLQGRAECCPIATGVGNKPGADLVFTKLKAGTGATL